ncbi:MAG: alkaline phosphatase family protein [Flavobacteriales bacterium]|nr:alkaline phosphatase family protein [Flavobacteriales bacterium]
MKYTNLIKAFCWFIFLPIYSCTHSQDPKDNKDIDFGHEVYKIAFGSCGKENHPLPIFDVVVAHKPDMFIFLGDNIYGDTESMELLKNKYWQLTQKPSFQNLKQNVPRILATWDDHDYGENDAGRHYPQKEASKEVFLDFFEEPANSQRRKTPGIYDVQYVEVGDKGKLIQIILLDVRTFRDNLKPYDNRYSGDAKYHYQLDYSPYDSADSTLLGVEQWAWLESTLKQHADVRIIASGSQFGIEHNGYECWANFPHERNKMLDLIKRTRAEGVLFVTGDVHYAEVSKLTSPDVYPIYDITSSGLSSTWEFATPNKNRIQGPVMENHFGLLTIDFESPKPKIISEIWDVNNEKRISLEIDYEEISF